MINIHSFLYLFNHYLFTGDIWLNNTWSILARNSKFDLRIFKILLVFIMIICGRIWYTGLHWFQRIGLEVGKEISLFFIPIPLLGEGNGTPLQYSCLENPLDGGAWCAAVHGVAKSRTRLKDFPFTFHFHTLEKEMATHSSILAWRIPGTGDPAGLPSMGSHRVRHNWSDLAAAAAYHFYLNEKVSFYNLTNIINKKSQIQSYDSGCLCLLISQGPFMFTVTLSYY